MSQICILTSTWEHWLLLVVVLLAEDKWWSSRHFAAAAAWSSDRRTFLQTSAAIAVPASTAVLLGIPSATATSTAGTVLDPLPGQQVVAGLAVPTEEYNTKHLATLASVRHPFRYSDDWTGTALPLLTLDEALNAAAVLRTPTSAPQHQELPPSTTSCYWPMGRWPDPILRRPADPVNLKDWSDRTSELQRAGDILRQTAQVDSQGSYCV